MKKRDAEWIEQNLLEASRYMQKAYECLTEREQGCAELRNLVERSYHRFWDASKAVMLFVSNARLDAIRKEREAIEAKPWMKEPRRLSFDVE